MIIDAHCHAGRGDRLTGPWDTSAPLDSYLRRARRAGIERTVLFPVFSSDYGEANRQVAEIVGRSPDRFTGFAMVHPERDAGRVAGVIGEAVERYGFRGIKVHRYDARITREICDAARGFALPVLYDVMGEWAVVELLATEFPDVDFVIPHLGSFSDDWRAHLGVIDQMVRHPNVYADTSGVRRFDFLVQAVRRAGARKIIFGSDGPWLHPGLELAKVEALGLSETDRRLVLGGNLLQLLERSHRRLPEARLPRVSSHRPDAVKTDLEELGPWAGSQFPTG